MITDKQNQMVWTLHETEHLPKKQIELKVGISRPKVIEILKNDKYRNLQLINSINEINKKNNESLIEMLSTDNRIPSIANHILDIMNDKEQLANEIERYGLRPLMTIFGIFSDKAIKIKELDLRDKKPEAFNQQVTIINDADEVAQTKRIHKELIDETTVN